MNTGNHRGVVRGVFLSDIHFSDFDPKKCESINLTAIYEYIYHFKPDLIILGGDIVDAKGLHGVESFTPSQFDMAWYKRDCSLLKVFFGLLNRAAGPKTKYVFIAGNHEQRYDRLINKYPKLFAGHINLIRDGVPPELKGRVKYIPYGNYENFYKLGDCLFIHGDVYPDHHSKKYASAYSPYKVCYGHLHSPQIYSAHVAGPKFPARYAVTAGCLSKRGPEWKKGEMNSWVNGFVDFVCINGVTTLTPHFIENGKFYVGAKIYGV